jgi:ABC-type sulfate/molybdate transport systems ATPase subunit
MVTHDVDEALFLADRIVLMTNGPAATVGEIVGVPFERPRQRLSVIADPAYHQARTKLLSFLEGEAAHCQWALSPFAGRQTTLATRVISPEELFSSRSLPGPIDSAGNTATRRPGPSSSTISMKRAALLSSPVCRGDQGWVIR